MEWNELVGKKFPYEDKIYEIIRLLSQEEDTVVAEIVETTTQKRMILKIDVSRSDVFRSQIRKEQKIQEKLHLYDYFLMPIDEKSLFEDKEIVYNPYYKEIFDEYKEEERFPLEDEEGNDLNSEDTEFVLAVLMPNLGKPISYELLYNQAKNLNISFF